MSGLWSGTLEFFVHRRVFPTIAFAVFFSFSLFPLVVGVHYCANDMDIVSRPLLTGLKAVLDGSVVTNLVPVHDLTTYLIVHNDCVLTTGDYHLLFRHCQRTSIRRGADHFGRCWTQRQRLRPKRATRRAFIQHSHIIRLLQRHELPGACICEGDGN